MKPLPIAGVLASLLVCGAAYAAGAHVHGIATLQVAIDRNEVTLDFTSPLDNLVGFERAPRSDKEKAAVRRMAEHLRQPEQLFTLSPEAKCTRSSLKLESPVIDPGLLEAGGSAAVTNASAPTKRHTKGKDTHASLTAEVVYRCEQPERLSALEVKAFDVFSGLKRVDAQVAGAKKQASARLTARARRLAW